MERVREPEDDDDDDDEDREGLKMLRLLDGRETEGVE